jgi:hypothetical protein
VWTVPLSAGSSGNIVAERSASDSIRFLGGGSTEMIGGIAADRLQLTHARLEFIQNFAGADPVDGGDRIARSATDGYMATSGALGTFASDAGDNESLLRIPGRARHLGQSAPDWKGSVIQIQMLPDSCSVAQKN